MVNQILLHISNTPLELVEYCKVRVSMAKQMSGLAMQTHGDQRSFT